MSRNTILLPVSLVLAGCSDGPSASTMASASSVTSVTSVTSATSATSEATSAASSSSLTGGAESGAVSEAEPSGTSTGGVEATSADATSDASSAGPKLDLGVVPDFGGGGGESMCGEQCQADKAGQVGGDWLLHISSANKLMLVDVSDASTTEVCTVTGIGFIKSLTFTRTNRLLASDGGDLYEIDPCTCAGTKLGNFSPGYGIIYGITPDEGDDLFGISAQANALVRINSDNAEITEIGPLGGDWGNHGATWFEQEARLYAINGGTNSLYTVDAKTGKSTLIGKLSVSFSTVGAEIHPATGRLYGCTGSGRLYEIDKASAVATEIGTIQGNGTCTNLGAPWSGSDVCLPVPG